MRVFQFFLSAGLALTVLSAQGQQSQPSQPAHEAHQVPEHRGPPLEALAACKSATQGAACNFNSPHGTEAGTCVAPEGKPLACRPNHNGKSQSPRNQDKPKN